MHPYIGMKCPVLSLLCPVLQIQTFLKLIIICADYTADKDLTLTVNGVVQSQTYEYASMVTVNAEESQNGKYFSGWYIDDKLVSENEEYTFYITDDISLTARYDGEAVIEKQPIVNMTMGERVAGETKDSVVMDVTWAALPGQRMYTHQVISLIRMMLQEKY